MTGWRGEENLDVVESLRRVMLVDELSNPGRATVEPPPTTL
jgi:hypothetical protein